MRKVFVLLAAVVLSGCATFNPKITYWGTQDYIRTADGKQLNIIGNPHLTCYSNTGKVIADGLFVRLEDEESCKEGNCTFLVIDEFGKDYVRVQNIRNRYCVLGNN